VDYIEKILVYDYVAKTRTLVIPNIICTSLIGLGLTRIPVIYIRLLYALTLAAFTLYSVISKNGSNYLSDEVPLTCINFLIAFAILV